ncbi:MAG: 30S ribosome-binding factor RbfA [Phycisphaerales bacterium]|nr:30S ribosome-binding factor RbfA [Phycisphaerales bacterium]MCB9856379.1 30S ribosome-binding factor RbfA [Phycisphaerales bacterium]MCB9864051.1 30S ribosome-binding factor RbfA [Phycisphaerales bacterium]
MAHRKERISHFVRDVVSDAIANRINDPRVHRFTSVTRVEVSPDYRVADVYVSVMGSENESKTSIRGLESARGMIQTRLAKQINMRQCPILRFHLDIGFKKAIDTIRALDEVRAGDLTDEPPESPHDEAPAIDRDDDIAEGN